MEFKMSYNRYNPKIHQSKRTGVRHWIPTNVFAEDPKFIFLHIPKTAGSSIQKWLHLSRFPDVEYPENWDGKVLWNLHGTAMDYRQKMGPSFDQYYKFAFVRNPWDRLYSIYRFLQTFPNPSTPVPDSFEEFALAYDPLDRKPGQIGRQTDFILDASGNSMIDFVGRFENLYEDLQVISEKISIPLPETMYRENTTEHKHYREYYSTESKEAVAEKFKSDIEYFKYEF